VGAAVGLSIQKDRKRFETLPALYIPLLTAVQVLYRAVPNRYLLTFPVQCSAQFTRFLLSCQLLFSP